MTSPHYEYYYCLNSFRTFEGKELKAKNAKDIEKLYVEQGYTFSETVIYLEEKHFIQNFH